MSQDGGAGGGGSGSGANDQARAAAGASDIASQQQQHQQVAVAISQFFLYAHDIPFWGPRRDFWGRFTFGWRLAQKGAEAAGEGRA